MENTATLTEEQKQQIKETIKKLADALKPVIQAIEKTIEALRKFYVEMWNNLKEFISKHEKARKYIKIYNKTHNQRIKKKQITKILKLIQ